MSASGRSTPTETATKKRKGVRNEKHDKHVNTNKCQETFEEKGKTIETRMTKFEMTEVNSEKMKKWKMKQDRPHIQTLSFFLNVFSDQILMRYLHDSCIQSPTVVFVTLHTFQLQLCCTCDRQSSCRCFCSRAEFMRQIRSTISKHIGIVMVGLVWRGGELPRHRKFHFSPSAEPPRSPSLPLL